TCPTTRNPCQAPRRRPRFDLPRQRFGGDAGNLDRATAQIVFLVPAGEHITDARDRAIIGTLVSALLGVGIALHPGRHAGPRGRHRLRLVRGLQLPRGTRQWPPENARSWSWPPKACPTPTSPTALVVSPLTIRTHIQRAMTKLHARDAPNSSSSPTKPA